MSLQRSSGGYTLNELTELTGVTSRTVRYYVSEGLLPPPVAAGPRSYYSDNHLQRLRLIGFMKDSYLPLREIRRRLQELDDDEILDAIVELEVNRGGADQAPARIVLNEPLEDPDLLQEVASPELGREPLEPQTWPFVSSRPGEYEEPVPQEPAWRLPRPIKAARHDPHNSTIWRKLAIGDSAEFLVEERLYQRRKEQVDALVVWAHRILDGN